MVLGLGGTLTLVKPPTNSAVSLPIIESPASNDHELSELAIKLAELVNAESEDDDKIPSMNEEPKKSKETDENEKEEGSEKIDTVNEPSTGQESEKIVEKEKVYDGKADPEIVQVAKTETASSSVNLDDSNKALAALLKDTRNTYHQGDDDADGDEGDDDVFIVEPLHSVDDKMFPDNSDDDSEIALPQEIIDSFANIETEISPIETESSPKPGKGCISLTIF